MSEEMMTGNGDPVRQSMSAHGHDGLAFDRTLGARIKALRIVARMTLRDLAGYLGFSYQQMHKYEAGKSRLSVYALQKISTVLAVPIIYLLDDELIPDGSIADVREVLSMAWSIQKIENRETRRRLSILIAQSRFAQIEPVESRSATYSEHLGTAAGIDDKQPSSPSKNYGGALDVQALAIKGQSRFRRFKGAYQTPEDEAQAPRAVRRRRLRLAASETEDVERLGQLLNSRR